jgi:hypothetical protein
MAMKTTVSFSRSLKDKHAQRVPEYLRGTFHRVADGYVSAGDTAAAEFTSKTKTGLYNPPDARSYLRAEVQHMNRALADVVDTGHLTGTKEELKKLRDTENDIPRIDPFVAQELRSVLRGMSQEQREHAVRSSLDFSVASAVLHAPGGGLGLDISDEGLKMLRRNFNETHRRDLLQQIADYEVLLGAAEEFKRTVAEELDEILR